MSSLGNSKRDVGSGAFLIFCRRYCACFFAVIFFALSSFATAGILGVSVLFQDVPLSKSCRWLGVSGLAFIALLTHFNVMLVRGRQGWIWGNVMLLVGCLLFSLSALEYRPDKLTYVVGVFSPLIGLYLLGTDRYRELRQALVKARRR